jgi:hypothetical protein
LAWLPKRQALTHARARSFYESQQGGIDQRSLSFQAIPGTDKRIG